MVILNSLFPVFAMILIGTVLKYLKIIDNPFLKISDRLVYFIFFPSLLFWKIATSPSINPYTGKLCIAAICSLMIVYGISCLLIRLFNISDFQAGSFSQSCYRFNTYIGVAVVLNAFGEEGVRVFGVLIGILIPIINVLAVSTLIWFSGKPFTFKQRIVHTGKALIANPLIIACISGLLYSYYIGWLPKALENTLRMMSFVTLPLALLSIGAALTFSNLKGNLKASFAGSLLKLVFFPAVGFFFLNLLEVTGLSFQVGMVFFTLSTSPAIYVLSSQLNSDTQLASATIVLSTILSFFSLSVALLLQG
jgi:predicted permease